MYWLIGGALLGLAAMKKGSIKEAIEEVDTNWTRFDSMFKRAAAKYAVDAYMLKAIALNESSLGLAPSVLRGEFAPNDIEGSKSSDGKSWGLMQVTLTTARGLDALATEAKLNSADYSVDLAARYLKSLEKYFSKADPRYQEWIVKSYNQGPGNSIKERDGKSKGFAHEYWARFQRNYKRAKDGGGL